MSKKSIMSISFNEKQQQPGALQIWRQDPIKAIDPQTFFQKEVPIASKNVKRAQQQKQQKSFSNQCNHDPKRDPSKKHTYDSKIRSV